ncbi:hypothetical protein [Burkholderia ubonensis]|uniref:hypothetical protein n=1 Tax=Burkholderia ubonensis TaxID=101571 RepID=UPI000AA065DF|nr:hypothetical protein [Burkholderia ubonensis]
MTQIEHSLSVHDKGNATKTRIDGHPLVAKLSLFTGLLPLGVYWVAFNAFGSSNVPWQIALALEFFCPTLIYVHYLMNRRARRLYWEGIAAITAFVPIWMAVCSYWLFYLGFAPLPFEARLIALSFCLGITAITILITWRNYARQTERLGLVLRMPVIEPDTIVYPDTLDNGVPMLERSWNWLSVPPVWLVSLIGSAGTAYAMLTGRVYETTGGPHILFIMLSIVSFPLSCLIVGRFFVRLAYFHIYLPLKLERETGKKVILGS